MNVISSVLRIGHNRFFSADLPTVISKNMYEMWTSVDRRTAAHDEPPQSKVFVYSKSPTLIALSTLLRYWPEQCGLKKLKRYHLYDRDPQIACMCMLAHPIHPRTEVMDTSKIIEIMCVDTGYTVFTSDPERGQLVNLAAEDSYDLEADVSGTLKSPYRQVRVSLVKFPNERIANATIADDLSRKLSQRGNRRFGGRILCPTCRPDKRFEGEIIGVPKILDVTTMLSASQLLSVGPLKKRVFTKPHMVHCEYVTFMDAVDLPFVKGYKAEYDKYTQQFLGRCKSVVNDIETITVDKTLQNTIPDEVVTIVASNTVGKAMTALTMFTRKIPAEWIAEVKETGTIDTEKVLERVRNNKDGPAVDKERLLPRTNVVKCLGEAELILKYQTFLQDEKPHFLVSFNGHGFDNKYLIRASVANRLPETFHGALMHLTPLVKMENKDPLESVNPTSFLRPNGKNCKGLIPDSFMSVAYNSFPSMISIDLYPIHDTSLNQA